MPNRTPSMLSAFDEPNLSWTQDRSDTDPTVNFYISALAETMTETIDISTLAPNLSGPPNHDLKEIETTSLGKLLQALPIPSLLIGVSRTIVFANHAWEHISPKYGSMLHQPLHKLFPNPSASRLVESTIQKVFLTRKSLVVKGALQVDKRKMWGRAHFKFLRMGEETAILVLVEDLTVEKQQLLSHLKYQADLKKEIADRESAEAAMKASEQEMQTFIEVSPIGIALVQKSCCVYTNSAFREMFDYESRAAVLGRPMEDLIDPDAWQSLRLILDTDGKDDLAASSVEGKGIKKSGERFDITIWHRRIHYFGESALMIFVADTSESKALRSQLLQAQKMEAIGTLAGGIAHDFNNLLTIIQGCSELILLGDGTNVVPQAERILKACRRGADMVQRLLAFSRKDEPSLRPLKLNHQVQQFRGLLERIIPKMISIELRLAEDVATIRGDLTQIEQIIMNLALNARDAMPDGGTLIIETRNVIHGDDSCKGMGKKGPYVLLSVSDTGQGIERERMDHIFDPFFTTKETGKGTGLGLATVYSIVEQHNGHIRCDSEPGNGTTFRIYFPVTDQTEQVHQKIEIEATCAGGNETILLVDDEAPIRELAHEILEDAGYTVLTADNGITALEAYQKEADRINLVILDLNMPHMSGRQCLEKLIEINALVKVLLCSGYCSDGNMNELIQSGAIGIVKKPYSVMEMLCCIRAALNAAPADITPNADRRSTVSEKKRIDALDALLDLHDGMTHKQLMTKHGLSRRGLNSLLIKLQEVRDRYALSDADLNRLRTDGNKGERTKTPPLSEQYTTFSGNVDGLDILEVFQLMILTGRQVTFEVSSRDGRQGLVFIDKGEVKHAVCDQLEGEEALFACLGFDGGRVVSRPWSEPDAITINKPGEFILMEAARRRDEANRLSTARQLDLKRDLRQAVA